MFLTLLLASFDDAATSQARTAQQNEVRARLGISRERPFVGLRGRLAWVFEAFSERVGMFTFSLACSEPNVRGHWGYHLKRGPVELEADLGHPAVPGEIKRIFLDILHKKGPAANMLDHTPERTRLDPFIPWLARQIKWIDEENPPVKRLPKSRLFCDLGGTMTVTHDLLAGFLVYVEALRASVREAREADHAYNKAAFAPGGDRAKAWRDYQAVLSARRDSMMVIYRANGLESISIQTGPGLYPPDPGSLVQGWEGAWRIDFSAQDILRQIHLLRLAENLPLLLDWATAGNEAHLEALHYPEAVALAKVWHREIEAREAAVRKTEAPVVPIGGSLLVALPSGAAIYELGPSDLRSESEAMHHCVGRSSIYRTGIERGDTRIFSIRNANGSPEFTLEATPLGRKDGQKASWVVVQWKGSGNRVPGLSALDTRKIPFGEEARRAWIARFPSRILWEDVPLVNEAAAGLKSIRILHNTSDLDLVLEIQ